MEDKDLILTENNQLVEIKLSENQIRFIEMLPIMNFNISKTCEAIGIRRDTFYKWLKNNKSFDKYYNLTREKIIDLAEENAVRLIKDTLSKHNWDATKHVLDKLGKDRGWGDSKDDEKAGVINITINTSIPRPGDTIEDVKIIDIEKIEEDND